MKKATEVFGEWAVKGKDKGMEKSHALPVGEMLDFTFSKKKNKFTFLDLGCGNGWVVRKVAKNPLCIRAVGIDGAAKMVSNARSLSSDSTEYILADIDKYQSKEKYDIIHSMEVLYYLENPKEVIKKISDDWLKNNGRLIIGIDHYYENTDSHSWQEKVGTRMLMLKEKDWLEMFKEAGLKQIESWRANKNPEWEGTLVITGKK
tara:strand:+ start:458 stop:1069 length:612 start_codon:yes stop_codon:yes gene_type:complete